MEPNELEDKPVIKPSRKGDLSSFNVGGGTPKIIIISLIVTAIVLAILTFSGGVTFVTKKDFTSNVLGVYALFDPIRVDIAKIQESIATEIPNIITNQVGSAVTQATSEWDTRIASVLDRTTVLESTIQVNIETLTQLASEVESAYAKLVTLANQVTALESEEQLTVIAYKEQLEIIKLEIATLKVRVDTLLSIVVGS